MSMSWAFPTSNQLATAVKYAQSKGVIAVALAATMGDAYVYPGALPGVINVASTSTTTCSPPSPTMHLLVFMAAPGEGIMTLYPGGTYAAGWGTSFSTPFVAGTTALMLGQTVCMWRKLHLDWRTLIPSSIHSSGGDGSIAGPRLGRVTDYFEP